MIRGFPAAARSTATAARSTAAIGTGAAGRTLKLRSAETPRPADPQVDADVARPSLEAQLRFIYITRQRCAGNAWTRRGAARVLQIQIGAGGDVVRISRT